jgi:hypothetical protein
LEDSIHHSRNTYREKEEESRHEDTNVEEVGKKET